MTVIDSPHTFCVVMKSLRSLALSIPYLISTPRGVLPEKLGGGVQPASKNSYPIYDQNLRYSLPYL